MAYMSQENKKSLMPAIKAVLKKYKMKASVGVRHHSSLVCNIVSGEMDLVNVLVTVTDMHKLIHTILIDIMKVKLNRF